jgi:hypothetical protein
MSKMRRQDTPEVSTALAPWAVATDSASIGAQAAGK